jgi:hypothetical protein
MREFHEPIITALAVIAEQELHASVPTMPDMRTLFAKCCVKNADPYGWSFQTKSPARNIGSQEKQ